jgi:hypothetical protein
MSKASNLAGFTTSIIPPNNLVVGVITATSLSIDGQTVSSLGVGINTAGGSVGTGATVLDFRGAGISTVTVSSGIATVNIEGGGGGGASVTTSDTAPSTPADGDLWYDSVGGRLYVYYEDPNTSQWVDAAPQGGGDAGFSKLEVGNTKAEVTDTGSNGTFTVTTEGTGRLSVDSSGRTLLGGVTANANGGVLQLSSGITFPATAVAATDPNTLDDYEEGTWTPTIEGTSTAGTATYATRTGSYTKVGNLVHISLNLTWSSGTGTGSLKVTGLPFVPGALGALAIAYVENIVLSANNYASANVHTNNNIFILQTPTGGGVIANVAYDAAGTLIMAGSYSV